MDEVACLSGEEELEEHTLNALTSLRSRHNMNLPLRLIRPLQDVVNRAQSPLPAYQAVRLLGSRLDLEEVFGFVNGCLRNPEPAVRIAAVQAMREAGTSRAEDVLRNHFLQETDEEVLQAVGR